LPWISYAQNAEDVRLRRAFAGQTGGFYIDVGANHPLGGSVTKHFYDEGWSGINVEPLPQQFALIAAQRSRDINLNVGCSAAPGQLTLFAARKASSMSTFTAAEAEQHRRNGVEFDEINCPVRTLADICAEHARGKVIDFLSVDVEGHERDVLAGGDFSLFRPRIVVVEATRPNSTEPTHECWEHLLLERSYLFAVFDGLNRYYVRREDEQLVPVIALGPNVFDDYVPYVYHRKIELLEARLAASNLIGRVSTPIVTVSRATRRLRAWVSGRRQGR